MQLGLNDESESFDFIQLSRGDDIEFDFDAGTLTFHAGTVAIHFDDYRLVPTEARKMARY
jgi:hypothetical protein